MKKVLILTAILAGALILGCVSQARSSGSQAQSGGSNVAAPLFDLSGSTYTSADGRDSYISFITGNNFTGSYRGKTMSGTYSISGYRLTINITGGTLGRDTWEWVIMDEETARGYRMDGVVLADHTSVREQTSSSYNLWVRNGI